MVKACQNLACHQHRAANDYLHLYAKMHRLMKYYVCHKFGISHDYNMYEQHPWHGAGQGAADTALHYIALSDVLINAYHTKIQPSIIHDLTLTMIITCSIKAFINDVAMVADTPTSNLNKLLARTQAQLIWWNQLIQVTGGALNSKKCCYAFYHWLLDTLGILCLKPLLTDVGHLTLSPQDQHDHIPILSLHKGTRYLGVYIATSRSTITMENQLWKKAITYTKAF